MSYLIDLATNLLPPPNKKTTRPERLSNLVTHPPFKNFYLHKVLKHIEENGYISDEFVAYDLYKIEWIKETLFRKGYFVIIPKNDYQLEESNTGLDHFVYFYGKKGKHTCLIKLL